MKIYIVLLFGIIITASILTPDAGNARDYDDSWMYDEHDGYEEGDAGRLGIVIFIGLIVLVGIFSKDK